MSSVNLNSRLKIKFLPRYDINRLFNNKINYLISKFYPPFLILIKMMTSYLFHPYQTDKPDDLDELED